MHTSLRLSRYSLLRVAFLQSPSEDAKAAVEEEMTSIERELKMDGQQILNAWSQWLEDNERRHVACARLVNAAVPAFAWDIGYL